MHNTRGGATERLCPVRGRFDVPDEVEDIVDVMLPVKMPEASLNEDGYDPPEGDGWGMELPETDEYEKLLAETLQYPGKNDDWEYDVYETYVSLTRCRFIETLPLKESMFVTPLPTGALGFPTFEIKIPNEIDGLPIRRIGDRCFALPQIAFIDKKLRDYDIIISLPPAIAIINDAAFENPTGLTNLRFSGDSLIKFGSYVFSDCESLINPNIWELFEHMAGNYIPSGMFSSCERLDYIAIPDKIKTIERFAFLRCSRLRYVDLGNVEKIERLSFAVIEPTARIIFRNENCEIEPGVLEGIENPTNTTIVGKAGSTAAQIASKMGCTFELIKD